MSKENEATARERFAAHRGDMAVRRLTEILEARLETHRDRLEKEADALEAAALRGKLKELREIISLCNE
jgi:hypothetical protein